MVWEAQNANEDLGKEPNLDTIDDLLRVEGENFSRMQSRLYGLIRRGQELKHVCY